MNGFTPEQLQQLKDVVRESVRSELSDAGLRLDDTDHKDEARADFSFVRRMRKATEGAAGKIGGAIITILVGGTLYLFWQGFLILKGH